MSVTRLERAQSTTADDLHLILLPTEACNFRCVYCYETFRLKRMERWVVDAVKILLNRRTRDLRTLKISWFGGEPLLASDLVEELQQHAANLVTASPKTAIRADMTTNGSLLTLPLAERLAAMGLREYQITFDGCREDHNRKRVLAGGRGTFDLVWGRLVDLRQSSLDLRVTVRVHADRENLKGMVSFLDSYRAEFGDDSRFELFIRGLSRLGGENDASLPILEGDEGVQALQALRERAASLGLRQLPMRPSDSICYAARGNSFIVRSDGRINKCTVALDHPSNQVGKMRPDGTMELWTSVLRPWMRGLQSGDRKELQCPSRGLTESDATQLEAGKLSRPRAIHLAIGVAS